MMAKEEKIKKLVDKAQEAREGKLDLSSDEDLSVAIMNLISIEEHFYFTAKKTDNDKYFDLLKEAREIRKELLKKIVKDYEGEVWCISKHLLAASMRLMEVGTKQYGRNNKKEAKEMFEKAYDLYSLFWGINLKKVELGEVEKMSDDQLDTKDMKKTGVFAKLKDLVKKAVDCCIE